MSDYMANFEDTKTLGNVSLCAQSIKMGATGSKSVPLNLSILVAFEVDIQTHYAHKNYTKHASNVKYPCDIIRTRIRDSLLRGVYCRCPRTWHSSYAMHSSLSPVSSYNRV